MFILFLVLHFIHRNADHRNIVYLQCFQWDIMLKAYTHCLVRHRHEEYTLFVASNPKHNMMVLDARHQIHTRQHRFTHSSQLVRLARSAHAWSCLYINMYCILYFWVSHFIHRNADSRFSRKRPGAQDRNTDNRKTVYLYPISENINNWRYRPQSAVSCSTLFRLAWRPQPAVRHICGATRRRCMNIYHGIYVLFSSHKVTGHTVTVPGHCIYVHVCSYISICISCNILMYTFLSQAI